MPPQFIINLEGIDLNRVLHGPEQIRKVNPQRPPFEMLDAIVYVDKPTDSLIGYKDVREDEFWVPGHIPGRPLFPGVLQIELAAQVASFYTKHVLLWEGFIGFGGVENCKFRQQVLPGQRLHVLTHLIWIRHKRICAQNQGLVDGKLVFECEIIGVQF